MTPLLSGMRGQTIERAEMPAREEAVQKDGAVPKELHLKADFIRILDGKI